MLKFKTIRLMFAIAVMTGTLANAQLKATWNGSNTPGKQLMVKILDAWTGGDTSKAVEFYDKSARNVYFDIMPLQYKGVAEYESGVKQVMAGFQSFHFTLHDDVDVHRSSSLAWATCTWTGEGKQKTGNRLSLEGRWTVVWEKKGSKWLIVHEHLSVPWAPESESRHR